VNKEQATASVYQHIDAHFDTYLEDVRRLVRQPSVAAQNLGIHECAEMVCESIRDLGSDDVHLVHFPQGSPVVYGSVSSDDPDARTLIVYCLYDVQPPEPLDEWRVDPFAAEVVDVPPYGSCLVGRGVTNSKGPLVGCFSAVSALRETLGGMPLNLIFVIEGEEEVGSVNLKRFVREKAAELERANGVYLPGVRQDERGKPKVLLGNKGMAYFELEARGGDWGGPRNIDVHGMNAAWIGNPVWRLVWALNTLRAPDGKVLVEGFYDDVRGPSERDEALLARLAATFDEDMFRERADVSRFEDDLHGVDLLRRFLFTPTFNIDGIYGGYTGEGIKTIVPHRGRVKIDVRIVPDMDPDDVLRKVQGQLQRAGFGDISVVLYEGTDWSKTDPDSDLAQAAIRAMEKSGYGPGEIWPLLPGTGPACLFTRDPLSMPFVAYGLGHGGRIHAPNEYLVVKGLHDNIKSVAALLLEYTFG
jgi:acetylornithine deacetylase/succinyl-diaminopimelate desuccinylase-like protein